MKKFSDVLLSVCLALIVLTGSAIGADSHSASGTAMRPRPAAVLDPSFGAGGLLRVPNAGMSEEAHAALLADGDLLFPEGAEGEGLRVLSSSGGGGASFGGTGTVTSLLGRDEFRIEDFALDPEGRLLLVGTGFPSAEKTTVDGENGSQVSFVSADAEIVRVLPDGRLDPSFGEGGVVETSFGLPPAHDADGRPFIANASIGAGGVAVDRRGRIVVTGEAGIGIGESCTHDIFQTISISAPFIARLTEDGTPDLSFSGDGLVGGRAVGETPLRSVSLAPPVISPDGTITYRPAFVGCGGRYGVAQLTADGRVRKTLGRKGALGGAFVGLAADSDGSVLALAPMRWTEGEHFRARIVRITPRGTVDRSFGRDGQAVVKLGSVWGNKPDSIAIDSGGRILLGATLVTAGGRWIDVTRLSADGHQEMDFGPNGRVTAPVPGLVAFGPGDLLVGSQGRLLAVHRYEKSGDSGLVLARFSLRN